MPGRILPTLALTLLIAGAARTAIAAWPPDPFTGGLPVCTFPSSQFEPQAVPDGAGGMIVTWLDVRPGASGLYAQRVAPDGTPRWTAGGVRVSGVGFTETPRVVPDGFGGAIVVWAEFRGSFVQEDIFAQRLDSLGMRLWGATDVIVCNDAAPQQTPLVAPDGTGGAIVAWLDHRGFDIYTQRVLANGTTSWTTAGPCGFKPASTILPRTLTGLVPDGQGGAIYVWQESSSGNSDVYAQRFDPAGIRQWGANGTPIASGTGNQSNALAIPTGDGGAIVSYETSSPSFEFRVLRVGPSGSQVWPDHVNLRPGAGGSTNFPRLQPDGAGGALVAWSDTRSGAAQLYVQRVGAGGTKVFASAGHLTCSIANAIGNDLQVVPDGAGGLVVAWLDGRAGSAYDVYAQRVSVGGVSQWTENGRAIARTGAERVAAVADGGGGALLAWGDRRGIPLNGGSDIYAQRVDGYGYNGDSAPDVTQVRDVALDQGGAVRVSWARSPLDAAPDAVVQEYRLWRQVPASLAARRAEGRGWTTDPDLAAASGRLLARTLGSQSFAWELVASQPAAQLASYSLVMPTLADSTGAGVPWTVCMVEARAGTAVTAAHWFSAPDSGYSVDDLAPATPAPFTGTYAAGVTHLNWLPNAEPDVAGYRLYRGLTPGFVVDAGSRIASLTDTDHADAAGSPFLYKLTAVDIHGNESAPAFVAPQGIVSVSGAGERFTLALAGIAPHPVRHDAAVRFTLSRPGLVALVVTDVGGRDVAVLVDGPREAGTHTERWIPRDAQGRRLPAGVYFLRLAAEGRTLTRRLVLAH